MGRCSEPGIEDLVGIDDKPTQLRLAVDLNPTPEEALHSSRMAVQDQASPLTRLGDQKNLIGLFKNQAGPNALSRTPCQEQSEG